MPVTGMPEAEPVQKHDERFTKRHFYSLVLLMLILSITDNQSGRRIAAGGNADEYCFWYTLHLYTLHLYWYVSETHMFKYQYVKEK